MLITDYLSEIGPVVDELAETRNVGNIAKVIVELYEAWIKGNRIYICGNGGSASTASHFACDLIKIGVPAQSLDDNGAVITMISNDDGFDKVYVNQLHGFKKGDVLFCISVHGGVCQGTDGVWSQNLIQAIEYVQAMEGTVLGLVGNEGGIIRRLANASVKVRNYSTPIVESMHVFVTHLIVEVLKAISPVKMCNNCNMIRLPDNFRCKCNSVSFTYTGGMNGNIEEMRKVCDNYQSTD
uniref:Putative SIS domain-containing protein n=1 Tax=viral metagenome TaxID=1070528 RepID=A0A6M3IV71_9ZZZZ